MSFEWGVAALAVLLPGIALGINSSGHLVPADDATAIASVGRCAVAVTGTTEGTLTARFDQGIFRWAAGTNPPTNANRGQLCYWQDDQTVTMTPTGVAPAGTVEGVDSQGVYVLTALGLNGSEGAASAETVLNLYLADLVGADAKSYYIVAPFAATITKLETILNAALTTGNAVATASINGTPITGGAVTMVQSASAAGQENTASPSAANVVAAGDKISVTISGTQASTSASANLSIYLAPL
jgi:hypothetical protein